MFGLAICLILCFYSSWDKLKRMKKHSFFLIYEDGNDIQFKLIKTYVNRFIIDEDAEHEVIGTYELTKPPEFSEYKLVRKIQNLYSHSDFIRISDIFQGVASMTKIQYYDYQRHCLFSLSIDYYDLAYYLISAFYITHCSVLLMRSKKILTEEEFRSIPQKRLIEDSNISIGDDIDLLIDKFQDINTSLRENKFSVFKYIINEIISPIKFLNTSQPVEVFGQDYEYLGIFKEFEDSFMKIECQRRSFPQNRVNRSSKSGNSIPPFIFQCAFNLLTVLVWATVPYLYYSVSQPILNLLLAYFNESILISFCLSIFTSLSVMFLHWKSVHYVTKRLINLLVVIEVLICIKFPGNWVLIFRLFISCLYLYACYDELFENSLYEGIF